MDVGAQINQYVVIEHIGRGGMADVWSARDSRLNRMVAIKTMAHGLSQEIDTVQMFKQEAQTIAQMEHPHILPIYDFGEFENNLFIVMRYVTGGSLEHLLEDGPMPPDEVLRMGQAVASALDHAHQNKVIHLDLKPPNILLDSSQSPYVADFGLATRLDPEGRAQNPGSGTLLYMAPEQMVAEVIDHRADIYSFSIMLFHMLTGRLPFDGAAPLALKQLQYQQELPDLENFNLSLPSGITSVLRHGTAQVPDARPDSLNAMIAEMRDVLGDSTAIYLGESDGYDFGSIDPLTMTTEPLIHSDDSGLLEAVDIYSRARHAWAGGQGRFLLGITHFMLMSGYYRDLERYGLTVDEVGLQMLLRGALEYDHDLDFWWAQLDEDNQRWVCLHAIRSENPAARIRALYRLETLPDDENRPVIPRLVAQALQVEVNAEAKMAALQVLGTRARLMKPHQSFQISTEFRGRLLTTMTRLGIQVLPPSMWQEAVFGPEIDLLLAEIALDRGMPDAADYAARVIGRIRSLTAVRYIANEQRSGHPGGLRALALVRDEAPSMPPVVSREGRLYAWLANTVRRIGDRPFENILRFVLAMFGGWIAMGQMVFVNFRSQALFTPQRLGNTFAIGLLFGLLIGVLVLVSNQFSARLRGFWPWWTRLAVFGILGFLIGLITWGAHTSFFFQNQPAWDLMRFGGLGLGFGFVLSALLNLRGWQALLVTAVSIYLPLYASFYNACQQLFICLTPEGEQIANFTIAPTGGLGLLAGVLIALLIPRPRAVSEHKFLPDWPGWLKIILVSIFAYFYNFGIWLLYSLALRRQVDAFALFNQDPSLTPAQAGAITWDVVTAIFVLAMSVALVATYLLRGAYRLTFIVVGGAVAVTLYISAAGAFQPSIVVPQYFDPSALVLFDDGIRIITLGVPFALLLALGGHAQSIFTDMRVWIGEPQHYKERGGVLAATVVYVMLFSALIGVFSLFQIHADLIWSILWIAWAVFTFVCGMATWQWQKWGARGLVFSAVLLIIGVILLDGYQLVQSFMRGEYPRLLLEPQARVFWAFWAMFVAVFIWGTARRFLWGAMGLVVMTLGWVFVLLFTSLPLLATPFALTSIGLMLNALSVSWGEMETAASRKKMAQEQMPVPQRRILVASPADANVPVQERERIDMATELDVSDSMATLMEARQDVPARMNLETRPAPEMPQFTLDTSHIQSKDTVALPKDKPQPTFKLDTSQLNARKKPVDMKTEIDVNMHRELEEKEEPDDET